MWHDSWPLLSECYIHIQSQLVATASTRCIYETFFSHLDWILPPTIGDTFLRINRFYCHRSPASKSNIIPAGSKFTMMPFTHSNNLMYTGLFSFQSSTHIKKKKSDFLT